MAKILLLQKRWKEYRAEKNIVCDSPTAEQFLSFFTELFNQGVSRSVLISAKGIVARVHITTHLSEPISNKIFQRDI